MLRLLAVDAEMNGWPCNTFCGSIAVLDEQGKLGAVDVDTATTLASMQISTCVEAKWSAIFGTVLGTATTYSRLLLSHSSVTYIQVM